MVEQDERRGQAEEGEEGDETDEREERTRTTGIREPYPRDYLLTAGVRENLVLLFRFRRAGTPETAGDTGTGDGPDGTARGCAFHINPLPDTLAVNGYNGYRF